MQRHYRERADFLLVYIEEAHAVDEWPISSARFNAGYGVVAVHKHKVLEDRAAAARMLVRNLNVALPVALDGIDNAFSAAFSPWPFRWYIVKQNIVVYKAMPRGCTYSVEELLEALEQCCSSTS